MTDRERELRDRLAMHGRSLFDRGYSCGSSGNISARLEDGLLVTPTNSSLGRLDPDRIAKVALDGRHIAGDRPSKEVPLHLAFYRSRPEAGAVVHLHSTHAVALSCLEGVDPADALPAITPYFVMRIGRLPIAGYFPPGDDALAREVGRHARTSRAVLMANHGPVVSGKTLDAAVDAAEELEEAARLFLMLRGRPVRFLTAEQCGQLPEL